jgi:hypothetical protein
MRTTLTLDADVAAAIERRRRELDHTLKQEVNDLLRAGLRSAEEAPPAEAGLRVKPWDAGESPLGSLDDVSAVIAIAEGEDHR